jgi:ribosomal RNA-processing protein 12
VAEIVLCVKEPNTRTRAAAYDLLVDLGAPEDGAADAGAAHAPLRALVTAILAGVAAGDPHHASASVMALARLLHAYPGPLAADGGRLLPALLPLLRSRSRESVKAALGFAKVAAARLPVDALTPTLADLLAALLKWSDDPKNKFRLRVRVVVERLARRLGPDSVAAAMPAADRRLLAHIRKQGARRDRKRGATRDGSGSEEEEEGEGGAAGGRSTKSGAASTWAHTALFSEGGTRCAPTAGHQLGRCASSSSHVGRATACGLGTATADGAGHASWTWHISTRTGPGTGSWTATCPTGTVTRNLVIQ